MLKKMIPFLAILSIVLVIGCDLSGIRTGPVDPNSSQIVRAVSSVNSGGAARTSDHGKQVIGYITQWDAWKAQTAGLPAQGALTHLNVDFSKYTILNFSFFGVAKDGSLHSGDLRNKNIYQAGAVQEPGPLFHPDIYSTWDWDILLGEIEPVYTITSAVVERGKKYGFILTEGGSTWMFPGMRTPQSLPVPLPKEGGAPGLLELGHQNGVKVVASIGGWSMCKHYPEMAADPVKRQRFVDDCKLLISIGFDGIDLDWEYPGPYAGMNFTGSTADFANFATLGQEIRAAIGGDKLLTSCFSADYRKLDGFNWALLNNYFDYYNFMTYDFNGGWSDIAGHNSPLKNYSGAEASFYNWQSTLTKIEELGIPKNKVNLGMAFYGRGVVCSGNAALNAPTVKRSETVQPDGPVMTCADFTNWPKDVYDGTPYYFYILQNTGGWTAYRDNEALVPYLTKNQFFLSYDDEESIGLKARSIIDEGLAGAIVWTVYGDLQLSGGYTAYGAKLKQWSSVASPLVNKINEVFAGGSPPVPDTVAPSVPANVKAAAIDKTSATLSWTASTDNVGVAGYKIYRDNEYLISVGISSALITGLTAGRSYSFQVSAFDAAGNNSARSAAAPVTMPDDPDPPQPAGFRIVGYIPDYKDIDMGSVQFTKLTHLNYAFLIPNSDGSVKALARPAQLATLVQRAHENGVKVQIAVGGWSYNGQELDGVFETLAKTEAGRNSLVANILAVVDQYGLDGADIDWEHPDPVEGITGSANYYAALLSRLSTELHARGKILSAAILPGVTAEGVEQYWAKGILDEVFGYVDFLNIMVYDGGDGPLHSPYSMAENSITYWITKRGMPEQIYTLGVPFYGRPQWKEYRELVAMDPDAPDKDVVNGIYYNGIATIKLKTKLAKEKAGGIMIWEVTQDTGDSTSLLNAIYEEAGGITPPQTDPYISAVPSVNKGVDIVITGGNFGADAAVKISGNGVNTDGQILSLNASTIRIKNTYAAGNYSAYVITGGKSSNTVTFAVTDVVVPEYPAWDRNTVYTNGKIVSWKGHNWLAQWWTLGEEPGTTGQWGVWKDLGPSQDGTDTQAPSVPAGLTVALDGTTGVALFWSASSDNVGVSGYKVYQNAVYLKSVAAPAASISGLERGATYNYAISAYDAAGNESVQSATTSITIPGEELAPVISSIASVTEGADIVINGSRFTDASIVQITGNGVNADAEILTRTAVSLTCKNSYPPGTYSAVVKNGGLTSNSFSFTITQNPGVPEWKPYTAYSTGAVVQYQGKTYICRQAHTSLPGWEPSAVPALWMP